MYERKEIETAPFNDNNLTSILKDGSLENSSKELEVYFSKNEQDFAVVLNCGKIDSNPSSNLTRAYCCKLPISVALPFEGSSDSASKHIQELSKTVDTSLLEFPTNDPTAPQTIVKTEHSGINLYIFVGSVLTAFVAGVLVTSFTFGFLPRCMNRRGLSNELPFATSEVLLEAIVLRKPQAEPAPSL